MQTVLVFGIYIKIYKLMIVPKKPQTTSVRNKNVGEAVKQVLDILSATSFAFPY